jgi:hypothetical protein
MYRCRWLVDATMVFTKGEEPDGVVYRYNYTLKPPFASFPGQFGSQFHPNYRSHLAGFHASQTPAGGHTESITSIKCIAADGWSMLPWFLPKGKNQMVSLANLVASFIPIIDLTWLDFMLLKHLRNITKPDYWRSY